MGIDNGTTAVIGRGVGKLYHIGTRTGSGRLTDRMAHFGRVAPVSAEQAHPTIWALRDVSFEAHQGEALGVIGRNGSGKSTLMKILARVTAPTEGRVEIVGRVGAMLQVGIGFHPQLTGRENIGLSGAIMGMSRQEVAAVEDEIVEFSEIGKFLDTPVKYYSSGMYMRLAFSVSVHLAAEVLLVDEILSVGDATFQTKSHDRMRQVLGDGRTVLYVSHSMETVRSLCARSIVLEQGRVCFAGDTADAIDYYQQEVVRPSVAVRRGLSAATMPSP
jgi:lipopolysaccharide transport system ATP-binding protein